MTPAEWPTILKPATKNGIPLPPLDYTSLYECLCTYAAKLWVKYGECCQHYEKVEDILQVLEHRSVKDAKFDFTPINMNPRFPQRWAVAAATRDQTRKQMAAGQSSMEGMWNSAASARWGAQQSPPTPAPAIEIPTPAPQQWNPPTDAPPSALPTSVGSGGSIGGIAARGGSEKRKASG